MLKITKGLKKKKKGKKSKKNKEEELFKPEELEAYRQQHQQQVTVTSETESTAAGSENDEWRKFQALTAGIDNVLRKTQGDLDRIKSTSFFQRVPPPSEIQQQKAAEEAAQAQESEAQAESGEQTAGAAANEPRPEDIGIVTVSESETESEEEEDIFDTTFVDAVEAGEVKLAYIPESPTEEELGGDDPFDTSIAERAILGPAVNTKGRKLVPLGAAVEVLTGRVEQVTCATKRPSPRRNRRQQDLLLNNFDVDDNGNSTENIVADVPSPPRNKTLLDDDDPIPFDDAPIDLSINLSVTLQTTTDNKEENQPVDLTKTIVSEFDVIGKADEEDDDEFAQLAAESLTKEPPVTQVILPSTIPQQEITEVFQVEFETTVNDDDNDIDIDPFDTTFAENILPGKAELKLIENEILHAELDPVPVNVEEKYSAIIKSTVSIQLTNPTGDRESISSLDRVDESCLESLKPIHRDLLGGSNTDLSKIADEPIIPNQSTTVEDSFSDYSDPFDTSLVEQVTAPGQAELKFIEKEILGEISLTKSLSDPDFNPRQEEQSVSNVIENNNNNQQKNIHRPDLLEVNSTKSVAFALPTPSSQPDLLATGEEHTNKHAKPLTPYYVRKNSIPQQPFDDDNESEDLDPFDTSFVAELGPGKVELKLIENEFINNQTELKQSNNLSDEDDFDPRADEKPVQQKPSQIVIPATVNLTLPLAVKQEVEEKEELKPDLLAVNDNVSAKVLTPAVEQAATNFDDISSYTDPFDTSIACNILPGKTELKLLENELINSEPAPSIKRVLTDPEFDPRNLSEEPNSSVNITSTTTIAAAAPATAIAAPVVQDLLATTEDQVSDKPLTPVDYSNVSFEVGGDDDDFDPFDTSVANNILPGKTELKILESEFI